MIPVLRCASGVRFETIAPGGFRILAALDGATKVLGRDLVITSGTDGHVGGRHPVGEAYDVRTRDLGTDQILRLYHYLRQTLGERFTVLYETPHAIDAPELMAIAFVNSAATGAHIHCQVKRDTVYPPPDAKLGQKA